MDPLGSGSATLLLKLKSRDPASLRGLSAFDVNFCFVDQSEEIQEEWKPGFLSNEEFTQAGLEKTRFFVFFNQPSGFFLFFSVFFFFIYICPEERVFRVFSVSRIQTLNYNHSLSY
jgi:hypothetical protein